MKILGIIPSRYGSTRFPGKSLAIIGGKTMVQRVYEQASKASCFNKIIVATDHQEIYDHIKSFNGNVIMTSPNHQSGTDRCHEVMLKANEAFDFIINIQGDEPFIAPQQIDTLASCLSQEVELATLVKKIEDPNMLFNPNVVKVVIAQNQHALYFSREAIPHLRGIEKDDWLKHQVYYKHLGIYAYRSDILEKIAQLPLSGLEKAESLEQLRWLDNGYTIKTAITNLETIGIDTPEDLDKATKWINNE
jgi:3-deoxy-manno-octulosonate cytidylyltransferase (CMP-KDO synthetase)